MPKLVLASQSPARLATLRSAGIEPLVVPSYIDEDLLLKELSETSPEAPTPAHQVLALARAKAEHIAQTRSDDKANPHLILGCDTMLAFEGEVWGKPADAREARARLQAMQGKSGELYTGHWLINLATGEALGDVSKTVVHFGAMSMSEIDAYVATGEPLEVAGCFTIDGLGGPFISGIEGDHHAVVGISLPLLRSLLNSFSLSITEFWTL